MFFACAKQVVKQPVITTSPSPQQTHKSITITRKQKKDTLSYVVEFQDSLKRQQFAAGIEGLLKSFLPELASDSAKNKAVKIQIIKPEPAATPGPSLIADTTAIQRGSPNAVKTEPLAPVFGGTVKAYMQRGFIDQDIGPLLSPFPFNTRSCNGKDSSRCAGYLTINNVADKGISLSLAQPVKNAAGRPVSVFDLVTGWTDFVKKHPAEARCLFRYVNGVDQFISGYEAVITGFQIVDDKTIVLQLTQSDPYAAQRLCTPRLSPVCLQTRTIFHKK